MTSQRSAEVYADFLLPHLSRETHLVDLGCGDGELTLELASMVGRVTGVDEEGDEIDRATDAARQQGIGNATFVVGDAYALDIPGESADAVLGHSVLEALERPADALAEMARILKPGGVVGVASVEYDGLVLAGPHEELVARFFAIREKLWLVDGADPYLGRRLRGLVIGAGFEGVVATSTHVCYGTTESVREFGLGRADDCTDDWYVDGARRHGLATGEEIDAMREAWLEWSEAPTSYAAFTWCRALGWKPSITSSL
jgi:SAM-dependent methyltransferase